MSAHVQRSRRSGIRLDPDRLDFELGRRGLTASIEAADLPLG